MSTRLAAPDFDESFACLTRIVTSISVARTVQKLHAIERKRDYESCRADVRNIG